VRFVPGDNPDNLVELPGGTARTNAEGYFVIDIRLPDRESDQVQYIRATMRRNVGLPRFTRTAHDTWDKIVETVFLALLATTLGTLLAIPLSFIAARNLMKPVRSPLASIALSVLGWLGGMAAGFYAVWLVSRLTAPLMSNPVINIVSVIVLPVVIAFGLRWAMPPVETAAPTGAVRAARFAALTGLGLLVLFGLYQLASLVSNLGQVLGLVLGPFAFLGHFLFQLSDILRLSIPVLGALTVGALAGSFLGRLGQRAAEKLPAESVKLLNLLFAAAAGAAVFGVIGWVVEWLYQIGRPEYTLWGPIAVGALLGAALAVATRARDTLPVGLVIYYITRTVLNALRSVEALVMAIVFVIAVGIGPFAGVMALGLHTIVSLAKLYSEQVESIQPGPLEAVQATGANRLQTIIYAVVPQIVPPYISYTMYRWDINVRMSTIIGFVGGGGIGFLLQQNINLLNYRAASAQMLAIAVVVASMDYISSVLREKYV
jgi:phosphonate ABC transporter permease subunit PhnE